MTPGSTTRREFLQALAIAHIADDASPEAQLARDAFRRAESRIAEHLHACVSGRELSERGWTDDVDLASEVDVSDCVPILLNGAYGREAA